MRARNASLKRDALDRVTTCAATVAHNANKKKEANEEEEEEKDNAASIIRTLDFANRTATSAKSGERVEGKSDGNA